MSGSVILLTEEPVSNTPIPRLELAEWRHRFGVVAGITTAQGGGDLGLFGTGPAGQVMTRWLSFRAAMQPAFSRIALGRQVHGAGIAEHTRGEGWTLLDAMDGHVTREPGVLLAVTVADCVPVYLAVPDGGPVGLLHAGWKGIAAGIIEAGVARLSSAGGCLVSEIVMHCGVSICATCYEVGPEVVQAVDGRVVAGKSHLDLRGAAARRALALGVPQVSVSTRCAAHDGGPFFSHRASGGAPGRMAAYIGRPLA